MEEYRELIKKAKKTERQMKAFCIAMAIVITLLLASISYGMVVYEEPTNLNFFFLCFSWMVGGLALMTIRYLYKDIK